MIMGLGFMMGDIEGDKLSNPASMMEYIQGAIQNSGDDGPHFNLTRPGQQANQAIQNAVNKIKEGGVNN